MAVFSRSVTIARQPMDRASLFFLEQLLRGLKEGHVAFSSLPSAAEVVICERRSGMHPRERADAPDCKATQHNTEAKESDRIERFAVLSEQR